MVLVHETAASLRFGGDDLDPEEITLLLGAGPNMAYRKGDARQFRKGAVVARTGMWLREVPRLKPGDLNSQITELLGPLTADLAVWRDLTRRFRSDIFCGVFLGESNAGIAISAEVLKKVAERGLLIDFDIYHDVDL